MTTNEGKYQIAGSGVPAFHGDGHGDLGVVLLAHEIDLPDDGSRGDFAPFAGIRRPQRFDAQAVLPVRRRVLRMDDERGRGIVKVAIPGADDVGMGGRSGQVQGSRILGACVIFHPNFRFPQVRAIGRFFGRPQRPERPEADGGHVADGDVAVHGQDSFRRLFQFRRIRIDAGRRAQGNSEQGQDLSHQNRRLRFTYGIWVAKTESI